MLSGRALRFGPIKLSGIKLLTAETAEKTQRALRKPGVAFSAISAVKSFKVLVPKTVLNPAVYRPGSGVENPPNLW
jgi:hypothetical protein